MSAAVVLLTLIGMAAIVWSACFVGCSFHTGNAGYEYEQTVMATAGLVALWPLNEISGNTAVCLNNNNLNGTYTVGPVVTTYNSLQKSDVSPGTFALNQPNIVPGDSTNGTSNPADLSACAYLNGGYVIVQWNAALGPPVPGQFTLEAWVVPNWTSADAQTDPSFRVVVSTSGAPAAFTGFALFASPDNLWSAAIGIGTQDAVATTGSNQTIVQGSLYFLVVTYDGSTLTLWVNPADTTQPPDGTAAASGYVPVASPVPLYIGMGSPGSPSPLFPFNGSVQDVAFYNVVLDGDTIEKHYGAGLGIKLS
jgi:Concanavalin A-like lectin/glucanases superfamily